MDKVKKFQANLMTAILFIGAVIMVILLLSVFFQVIFRYVLRKPLSWSEELARFCFVWISMLGAAATIPKSLTQGIDLLVKRFPGGIQAISNMITRGLMVIFSVILVFKGWELTTIVHGQTSAVMGLPMSYVYGAIPLAAVFMVVILCLDSFINFKENALRVD